MARVWTDKIVQYPRRYIITNNGDGTSTLTPSEGIVTSAGTPLNAGMMNGIETDLLGKMDKKIIDDVTLKKYELGIKSGLLYYKEVL